MVVRNVFAMSSDTVCYCCGLTRQVSCEQKECDDHGNIISAERLDHASTIEVSDLQQIESW